MTPRNKAIWLLLLTSTLTVILYAFKDLEPFPKKALPIIWIFFSWNFFAYGFSRDMWPWGLAELYGGKEGRPGIRSLWFWFTAAYYLGYLAILAISDQ